MIYKCPKGQNAFFPAASMFNWNWNQKRIGWKLRFLPSCRFIVDEHDQKDWSKACGISRDPFTNKRNSTMAGFRYDPQADVIEVNMYAHISGDVYKGERQLFVEIDSYLYVWMETNFRMDIVRANFMCGGVHKVQDVEYGRLSRFTREIGTWFGGEDSNNDGLGSVAPQDIEIEKEYIWAYKDNGHGILVPDKP